MLTQISWTNQEAPNSAKIAYINAEETTCYVYANAEFADYNSLTP